MPRGVQQQRCLEQRPGVPLSLPFVAVVSRLLSAGPLGWQAGQAEKELHDKILV